MTAAYNLLLEKKVIKLFVLIVFFPMSGPGFGSEAPAFRDCPEDNVFQVLSYLSTETVINKFSPADKHFRDMSMEYARLSPDGVRMKSETSSYWGDVINQRQSSGIVSFNQISSTLIGQSGQFWFRQLANSSGKNDVNGYEEDLFVLTKHSLREFLSRTEKKLKTPHQWLQHGLCFVSLMYIFHAHLLEDMKMAVMQLADSKDIEKLNNQFNQSNINRMLSELIMIFDKTSSGQYFETLNPVIWHRFRSLEDRTIPAGKLKNQYKHLKHLKPDHPEPVLIRAFIDSTYQTHYLKLFYPNLHEEKSLIQDIWDKHVLETKTFGSDERSHKDLLVWFQSTESYLCRHPEVSDKSPWGEELCQLIHKIVRVSPMSPDAI